MWFQYFSHAYIAGMKLDMIKTKLKQRDISRVAHNTYNLKISATSTYEVIGDSVVEIH